MTLKEQRLKEELTRIADNRLRQALRGHRLRKRQAFDLVETVLESEESERTNRRYLIARVFIADEAQLQVLRRVYGNDLIDKILAARAQIEGSLSLPTKRLPGSLPAAISRRLSGKEPGKYGCD
jgi:hypothetical protein